MALCVFDGGDNMAKDLGFLPVSIGERYFISYITEDARRVGNIVCCMNNHGVPMWYDYGIKRGESWKPEIEINIMECEAVLFFVSRKVLREKGNYLRIEFNIAKKYDKHCYIIWLDRFEPEKNRDMRRSRPS